MGTINKLSSMNYTIDNHKGGSFPKSVLSDLGQTLPKVFANSGFTVTQYAASIVATCSQGQRTAEFKLQFPTKSETILAIDHTVIRKTTSGRNVKSTRLLVCPKDVETTLGPLLAEPWTVVKRNLTPDISNAPSKA
jgi:hypothetical protein